MLTGTSAPADREHIERRVADWRNILRRSPAMARQILRKILPGKLELRPDPEGGVGSGEEPRSPDSSPESPM
jgi:hypothetical protein